MSLKMFLFYTLIRLKSIIVFLVSFYSLINLFSDQLCLNKAPSGFMSSQSVDFFDQLTLHFKGEPYISPHVYDLIHTGVDRYNEGGFPINCGIKHSLPSVNGKNRTVEYGEFFNNVIIKKRNGEIIQYNYTVEVSNKVIIKNFTRSLRVFYDLDENGMFKTSLMSFSPESCSLEAKVTSSRLICKRPDNLDLIYFSFLIFTLLIYSILCIWTRFSKGLSRRLMFKMHELFSETKGFEFCNEYTKSWVDFNNETCYVENNVDELRGNNMDTAFIGGKFYKIFRNEAFVSCGREVEKIELNITDGQYENLLKYIRILNSSVKNCFVEGTHFLTLRQVLKKYNEKPTFYIGARENLTDRIMDPEDKIGLVDSLNFNLIYKSCSDCCPKKLYKLYYHFLKFQKNCKDTANVQLTLSKNCGFFGQILSGKNYSLSPFDRPSYFKNSQWKYYISDLWKLLSSLDINMKEPSEKRKNSKALDETLSLSDEFLFKEIERINSTKKLKVSDIIDKVSIGEEVNLCNIVFRKTVGFPEEGGKKGKEKRSESKEKGSVNVIKERVKLISREMDETLNNGLSELEYAFKEEKEALFLKIEELDLDDESWEDISIQIKEYRKKYREAKSNGAREKIAYKSGSISEMSDFLQDVVERISNLSKVKKDNLSLNLKDRKIYIDEFTGGRKAVERTTMSDLDNEKKRERKKGEGLNLSCTAKEEGEKSGGSNNEFIDLPLKSLLNRSSLVKKDRDFSPTYIFMNVMKFVEGAKFQLSANRILEEFLSKEKCDHLFIFERNYGSFPELLNKLNFYELNYVAKALKIKNYLNDENELNCTPESEEATKTSENKTDAETEEENNGERIKRYIGSVCNRGVIELIKEENEMYKKRKFKGGNRGGGKKNKNNAKLRRGQKGATEGDNYEYINLKKYTKLKNSNEASCFILAVNSICEAKNFRKNGVVIKEWEHGSETACCNHLVKRYTHFLNKSIMKARGKTKKGEKKSYSDSNYIGSALKDTIKDRKDGDYYKKERSEIITRLTEKMREITK